MTLSFDVALLAPVPIEYLSTGADVCKKRGKVAFGSLAWELFRRLDTLRAGLKVRAYFYASHTGDIPRKEVSWQGLYIGYCDSVGGAHPDGKRYRPTAAAQHPDDNAGHWAVFWEVTDLQLLATPTPIPNCYRYLLEGASCCVI